MGRSFPKLCIVGCGAIVEGFYLPALKRMGWRPAAIVDPAVARAKKIGRKYNIECVAEDMTVEIVRGIDAAIVATPHSYHAPIATKLLAAGKHVLLEKPMATSCDDCDDILKAATGGGAVLSIALLRRFMESHRWVRSLIRSGKLGEISNFDFRVGAVFAWPVTTDSLWKRESAGGGVLIDVGAHIGDVVIWWLGEVDSLTYRDDSFGGVEADCLIELKMRNGAAGVVELSRTRGLRNTAQVTGSLGTIEIDLTDETIETHPQDLLGLEFEGLIGTQLKSRSIGELVEATVADWLDAINRQAPPSTPGIEAARSIALIEDCYRNRVHWDLPWTRILKE